MIEFYQIIFKLNLRDNKLTKTWFPGCEQTQCHQQEETVRMHPKKKTKGGAVAKGTMSLVLIAGICF